MQPWVCRSVSSKAGLTMSICLDPCAYTLISSDRFCRVTGFLLTWVFELARSLAVGALVLVLGGVWVCVTEH